MAHDHNPEAVYIGRRENMIAEVAAFDPTEIGVNPRQCKWLVTPIGVATWDTTYHPSKREAFGQAEEIANHYGVPICWV